MIDSRHALIRFALSNITGTKGTMRGRDEALCIWDDGVIVGLRKIPNNRRNTMTTKRKNKKELIFLATGDTEIGLEANEQHHARTGSSLPNRCYLCRRAEGDISIALDIVNKEVVGKEIELERFAAQGGNASVVFELCSECRILLNAVSESVSRKAALVVAPSEN